MEKNNELDCPYNFTSRCTMGRCNCKPKMKNKHCYDSLEDYLVTHPNQDVSEHAIFIVNKHGRGKYSSLEEKLTEIPESSEYFKWIEKNK